MHEMSAKYRQLKSALDGTFLCEKRAITSCYLPASDFVSIREFPEGAHEGTKESQNETFKTDALKRDFSSCFPIAFVLIVAPINNSINFCQ